MLSAPVPLAGLLHHFHSANALSSLRLILLLNVLFIRLLGVLVALLLNLLAFLRVLLLALLRGLTSWLLLIVLLLIVPLAPFGFLGLLFIGRLWEIRILGRRSRLRFHQFLHERLREVAQERIDCQWVLGSRGTLSLYRLTALPELCKIKLSAYFGFVDLNQCTIPYAAILFLAVGHLQTIHCRHDPGELVPMLTTSIN